MSKVHWEIIISIVFVLGGAYFLYGWLADKPEFWDAQHVWSIILIVGYSVVSFEYFRNGWLIHHARSGANISPVLTTSVLLMQCVVFIKGVYFDDWSLMASALIVNCGIVFSLYQIVNAEKKFRRSHSRK